MYRHIIPALLFAFISTMAFAHGSGQHVLGTVTAIDSTHMDVKTQKGATVSVNLTKGTRFREKGHPKSTEMPVVGDRVVIEVTKDNKTLSAIEVHFSAGKRVAPQAAPAAAVPSPVQ